MTVMVMITDVDECQSGQVRCQHLCRNTMGSFTCVCPPGSMLSSDKYTCISELPVSLLVCQTVSLALSCPWDTLACCWDVKQPTNNNLSLSFSLSLCQSVYLSICLSVCHSFHLSDFLNRLSTWPVYLSAWDSLTFCLSVSLSLFPSVWRSASLSLVLLLHESFLKIRNVFSV